MDRHNGLFGEALLPQQVARLGRLVPAADAADVGQRMAQDAVQDLKVRHVARRHDDDAVIRRERDMILQLGIRRADHIGESLGQLLPRVIDRHGKADIFQHRHERLPDMARAEEVDHPFPADVLPRPGCVSGSV